MTAVVRAGAHVSSDLSREREPGASPGTSKWSLLEWGKRVRSGSIAARGPLVSLGVAFAPDLGSACRS
jgi:hypothetical protein